MSVSMKILSNERISTGLGDKLYSSYNIVSSKPQRLPILSSNTKPIIGPCFFISTIDPRVEKFGLIVNGYVASI